MNKPTHRTDLKRVRDDIKRGASDQALCDDHPEVFFKYPRSINIIRNIYTKKRDSTIKPDVQIYWGESGTGKTKKAFDENPDAYYLMKPLANGNVWWDGYCGQTTVIIDEFYGWISYSELLQILDRHPHKIQTKGATIELVATKFVLTSNKPWTEWYPNVVDQKALERRIKEFATIIKFTENENIVEQRPPQDDPPPINLDMDDLMDIPNIIDNQLGDPEINPQADDELAFLFM